MAKTGAGLLLGLLIALPLAAQTGTDAAQKPATDAKASAEDTN